MKAQAIGTGGAHEFQAFTKPRGGGSMTPQEYASGLRLLASWYEEHPDVALPYQAGELHYFPSSKDDAAKLLRELGGSWAKRALNGLMYFSSSFGPLTLMVIISQDQVCRKRVVGYEEVPARDAYQREIVEWDCEPVLAP